MEGNKEGYTTIALIHYFNKEFETHLRKWKKIEPCLQAHNMVIIY